MGVLSNLEPKEVFACFEEISSIPRPSYKEGKISDYCVAFAKKHGIQVYQDKLKNIVMIKDATAGYENVAPIILQGHLDMVCEKEPDYEIDFEKEGLTLQVDGDSISAKGTTLGGDDGIALAYALAIMASRSLAHPRLEAIFTIAEEVGMDGAKGIDLSMLQGKKLINLDSEEEGYLLTSCAGGLSFEAILPVSREKREGVLYDVVLGGMLGGHSGVEIDKGRGNSSVLMGRFLLSLEGKVSYRIKELAGGLKDNAIPRETRASLVVKKEDAPRLETLAAECARNFKKEYAVTDPDICLKVECRKEGMEETITKEDGKKVILLLNSLPNGIQTMSANIEGLVETSLNLGIMALEEKALHLRYAVRSSVESARDFVTKKLIYITESAGGSFKINGEYPAWEYKQESALRDDMVRVYREMYGKEPKIQAIHAGLECGILAGKIKDLDAVSIGPDMFDVHTTEERLSISSTRRVWEYLTQVIAQK